MFRIMDQILGSFLSKVGEIIADYAHNKLETNFKLITFKSLQKNLKSLSVKACDVEEQIKHAERSGKKKRKREVEEWLGEVKSIETQVVELGTRVESQGFIKRLMNGGEAAQLNEQVCKLLEQTSHFGELLFDICGIRGETMLTTRMVGEAFERNLEKIWRLLESKEVLSIGVYGMGGVGKTTLAKGIYNRLQETYEERSVFWVTVSQEFTIKSLQDKIGHFLDLDLSDEDNEDIRARRVHGALSEMKNAILILDDVWQNIDLLKVGCPFSVECCTLIMTTRSFEVCRQIGCQEVIAVHTLGEEEAWNLFIETFTLGKEIRLRPEVEAIAKSVAKLCDGLPLGIITVAASMRGQTTIHAWRDALVELKESFADQDGMREGEVFKVLKYSFDRLHADRSSESRDFNLHQLCFLYLSLYPEDRDVEKEQLIGEFISEGLLDTRKNRRAQFDQGHVILDKLVNVCLFEPGYFEGVVKMHDLVRGMALKVCEGKYMVRAGEKSLKEIRKEEEWTEDVEKVSLFDCDIRRIEYGTSPNCPNLSTLLLRGNPLEFIPNSFFCKLQGLCTLDLRETYITELPNSLSDLKSLKALLLQDCEELEYVPYLGNMKALRELNLSFTAIKEVPQGVEELLNLRFLSMEPGYELEVLPSGLLRKLGSLKHVRLPYHLEASIEEIVNLKELEEFRGTVKSVGDFNCFIESYRVHDTFCSIFNLEKNDTFYSLQVGQVDYNILVDEYPEEDDRELYNKVVILTRCNLADEKVSGEDIEWLEMSGCEGLSKCLLDDIINPTSLRKLKMWTCGGTEFILRLMSAQETSFQLSSLEHIWLLELDDFKGVIDTPTPTPPQCVFLSLKKLYICHCNEMRKLGLPVSGFPNLEKISIEWCDELEEIFEDEGRGESVILPKLRWLRLIVLPKLESVFRRTMICNSIEEIRTQACQRLMNLGLPVWGFPNLEEIVILSCGEIKEIFEDEGMGESVTLPKLTSLYLESLPRLESVCRRTMICNSIEEIVIKRCPRLMKKLPVHLDVPPPPTLTKIQVQREWWESLEWDNPHLPPLLQPLLTFL